MLKKIVVTVFTLFFSAIPQADADWRSYVWTYEYMTMRKGTWELENYLTVAVPDKDDSDINTWKDSLEIEYGITDYWDISMYQNFTYTNRSSESDLEYDGFKIRTRYRIGEKGRFLLDPLLYFEYIRAEELSKPNVIEGKLILAKDISKFNIAYNQILKQEAETSGLTEHEYAFGMHYKITSTFRLGVESKGNYTEEKYYLGPTISVANRKMWLAFGILSALNNESDDIQARLIIGIPF